MRILSNKMHEGVTSEEEAEKMLAAVRDILCVHLGGGGCVSLEPREEGRSSRGSERGGHGRPPKLIITECEFTTHHCPNDTPGRYAQVASQVPHVGDGSTAPSVMGISIRGDQPAPGADRHQPR